MNINPLIKQLKSYFLSFLKKKKKKLYKLFFFRYEPKLALVNGIDGLDSYRVLAKTVPPFLVQNGYLLLEIGSKQASDILFFLFIFWALNLKFYFSIWFCRSLKFFKMYYPLSKLKKILAIKRDVYFFKRKNCKKK